jgi:Tol biopolymer transport system component
MSKRSLIAYVLLITAIAANARPGDFPRLTGPYLGQKPPGQVAEIFAPGVISTAAHEFSCCFSPDGREFYFTRRDPELGQNVVMVTKQVEGVWTEPAMASFAGPFTFEPFVTPDNKRIYFQTGKVVGGELLMFTMYADRTEAGWSEARDPGEPFNPMKTMHVSSTLDGTIYTTDISGGGSFVTNKGPARPGSERLGVIRPVGGKYEKLEPLGPPLDREPKSQHPWIAPDESFIVYTVVRPGETPANVLLFASRNKDGSWIEPRQLDLGRAAGQPFVSPDGRFLFFTSMEPGKGNGDIYWVDASVLKR